MKEINNNNGNTFLVLHEESNNLLLINKKTDEVLIAYGWNYLEREWDYGNYYGNGLESLQKAIAEINIEAKKEKTLNYRYEIKLMHDTIQCLNNENAYYEWIKTMPDCPTSEDFSSFANDTSFAELQKTFTKIFDFYKKDGIYMPSDDALQYDEIMVKGEVMNYINKLEKNKSWQPIETKTKIKTDLYEEIESIPTSDIEQER